MYRFIAIAHLAMCLAIGLSRLAYWSIAGELLPLKLGQSPRYVRKHDHLTTTVVSSVSHMLAIVVPAAWRNASAERG
jgi:hypothetical protein